MGRHSIRFSCCLAISWWFEVLQTASIAAALPFTIILIVMCFSLLKGLKSEVEVQKNKETRNA